jgi:hypothetical protein
VRLKIPESDLDIFTDEKEERIPIEDTKHLLTCDARQSRKLAAKTLWEDIHSKIREKQKPGSLDPRLLRPFALRDGEIPTLPLPPPAPVEGRGSHAPDPQRSLRQVAAFPDSAAELGLIPKGLVGALKELGVKREEAGQLADTLATLIQSTLAREVRSYSRDVAIHRDWPSLYGKHVLGKRPASLLKP